MMFSNRKITGLSNKVRSCSCYITGKNGKLELVKSYKDDVIDVADTGSFCMLAKREVYDKMQKPYYYYDDETGFPEDRYYCDKARALGYKIKVRSDLKLNHISHFGDLIITCEDGEARIVVA